MKEIKQEEIRKTITEQTDVELMNDDDDILSSVPDGEDQAEHLSGKIADLVELLRSERNQNMLRKNETENLIKQISHMRGAYERRIKILEATIIRIETSATLADISNSAAVGKSQS